MPRGDHHPRDSVLPGAHLPPRAEPAEAVLTVVIHPGESEPYDPDFEQWLSEQTPVADDPTNGALSRAWVAVPHRH